MINSTSSRIEIKELKQRVYPGVDHTLYVDRLSIWLDGAKIGHVHRTSGHSGKTFFDPCDVKEKTIKEGFVIQRKFDCSAAIDVVIETHLNKEK